MIIEIEIPSPGESITEVELANWLVKNGDFVEKDQDIAEIESDKATLQLSAPESGKIEIIAQAGDTIEVGSVACKIDTSQKGEAKKETKTEEKTIEPEKENQTSITGNDNIVIKEVENSNIKITPVAKQLMQKHQISVDDIINGLQRITKEEVELVSNLTKEEANQKTPDFAQEKQGTREKQVEKMSSLRRKLSERLVSVKNETAMLTTFNEVDMSAIMKLRKKYNSKFSEKFGIKLGLMSPFIKASSNALLAFPNINSQIDGENLIYHKYCDIGIAVQSAKGLMVPVIRNTETLSLAEIELKIKEYAAKGRDNKITIDEMTGGTFTITNGGTFGSLVSTPIINPPQSAILGMHNIVERPVAIDGKVEIRPMMYIALSYDHRNIDGKSAVEFLVKIKEQIENPLNLMFDNKNPEEILLGL